MLDKYANTNVGVKISYDIACTLEAHLKVRLYCLTYGCKPGEPTVLVQIPLEAANFLLVVAV